MCVRVCVCTCARSKLIAISTYCNSNIRLVILSEKAWLVISLVVSFRFSRHLFSVINFLHFFFSICKCRIWQINIILYIIVLYWNWIIYGYYREKLHINHFWEFKGHNHNYLPVRCTANILESINTIIALRLYF